MRGRHVRSWGCSRHGCLFPIGQHLSAEAQGWKNNMTSSLFPRGEGVNRPFFHFFHSQRGAEVSPLGG